MRKMLLACFMVAVTYSTVGGTPYFRALDPVHPKLSLGSFFDVAGAQKTDHGTVLALITHSTRDGSIFKSVQADWTLLGVGGGYGAGNGFIAAGPSANLSPVVKSLVLGLVDKVTKDGQYVSLKEALSPVRADQDMTVAFGPAFMVPVLRDGAWVPAGKWQPRVRVFVGAAWAW